MKVDLCLIGAGMICAGLMAHSTRFTNSDVVLFEESLMAEQKAVYREIVQERFGLYVQGMLIGIVLGLGFIYLYGNQFDPMVATCASTTIMCVVTYFYYIMMPKKKAMVNHLLSKNQIALWQKTYRAYQLRYWGGFLLGMLGFALVNYGYLADAYDEFMDLFEDMV